MLLLQRGRRWARLSLLIWKHSRLHDARGRLSLDNELGFDQLDFIMIHDAGESRAELSWGVPGLTAELDKFWGAISKKNNRVPDRVKPARVYYAISFAWMRV
jgi:hypothetical protein